MQVLQRAIQNIVAQLGALTVSARLLIAALMVILVMALLFVGLYAGRPSMVPLALPVSISAETRAKAAAFLKASGVPVEARGEQLMVPSDQSFTILARLMDDQLITGDQVDFTTLVQQESPFTSREHNQKVWLSAKMKVLERMIGTMTGIERAVVVIDEPRGIPGIGRAATTSSATVTVTTRGQGLAPHQVDAIATAVAKAHAGMKVTDVAVIDATAGKRHIARPPDEADSSRVLELKQAYEGLVKSKVEEQLPIPGMKVAVNAIVDARREESRTQEIKPPVVGPVSSETREINSTQSKSGQEAGVVPNTGAAIGPRPGGSGSSLTDTRSNELVQSNFPYTISTLTDAKGHALQINVAIGVPKSYIERVYKDEQGDPNAKADKAAIDSTFQAEQARIKQQVEPLILTGGIQGAVPGQISVSMIRDFGSVIGEGPTAGTAAESSSWVAAGGGSDSLIKYVGLGTLAFISLAMMLMMVRRAGARTEMPTAAELVGVPKALETSEADLVGEADESAPALEGVELDDDELRKQQMLTQINEMVTEKPDEAAALVRKWMRVEV